jgi:hypothetical protein
MIPANGLKFGGALAIGSFGAFDALQAQSLTPTECLAEYRATMAAGTASNTTWDQFRKANCPSPAQAVARTQAHTEVEAEREASAKHVAQCMRDWDAATHMTKQEWARTCARVVKNRIEFRLDQTK